MASEATKLAVIGNMPLDTKDIEVLEHHRPISHSPCRRRSKGPLPSCYIPSSYSMVFFSTFCPFSNEDDDNNDDDGARDGGGDDGRLEQADHRRGGLRARGAQILGGGEALPSTAAPPTREAEKHLEQRILLRGRSPFR